jgi:uncharacterized membrane protein
LRTVNEITIKAPWKKVFKAAAQVEDWPKILPHYRFVTVLAEKKKRRIVDMGAHRDGFPCRWRSEQVLDRKAKKIYYLHVKSFWTQGMHVWWILKPKGRHKTEILLTHDQEGPGGFNEWFLQRVVLDQFVHNIAGKTLAGLKRHLEAA